MAGTGDGASKSSNPINGFAVLAIFVVMAALVTIVWKVVDAYSAGSDAVSVLGIVIPMFATVGAAVFGIPIAYSRGADAGQQQANAQVPQKIDAATQQTKTQLRQQIEPNLQELQAKVDELLSSVRTQTSNPPGTDVHTIELPANILRDFPDLAASARFAVPTSTLSDIERQFGRLQSTVQHLDE